MIGSFGSKDRIFFEENVIISSNRSISIYTTFYYLFSLWFFFQQPGSWWPIRSLHSPSPSYTPGPAIIKMCCHKEDSECYITLCYCDCSICEKCHRCREREERNLMIGIAAGMLGKCIIIANTCNLFLAAAGYIWDNQLELMFYFTSFS